VESDDVTLDTWRFGSALAYLLLTCGVLEVNRNVAISEARQAQKGWGNAVLVSVEDVQAGLSLSRRWRVQRRTLESASQASARALSLSRQSYSGDAITLTDVPDSERDNVSNQLAAAAGLRDYALGWAQLQVATGGG